MRPLQKLKGGGSEPVAQGRDAENAVNRGKTPKREEYVGEVSGKPRISDNGTNKSVWETKNVVYQYFSTQIKDAIAFAKSTGRQFVLYLRQSTKISKPLEEQIKKGNIKRRKIPGSK